MGAVINLRDRLVNLMSGLGTSNDQSRYARHVLIRMDPRQIEAAYRSSWLMRNAVDIPPYDMTRAWRDWQASKDQIEKIEAEERRLGLREKVRRALILGRLGGGALILGTRDADPSTPLPAKPGTGYLTYVHVMSRYQLTLGQQITDPTSDWFGQPAYFEIRTAGRSVKLHPSRVVAFRGQQVPDMGVAVWDEWFWGDPIAQAIDDAVKNADLAQAGFASLIEKARQIIIKMPDLMAQAANAEYEERFLKRLSLASLGASNHQFLALDGEEDFEQLQVNWAGMPDIIRTYLSIVAGATGIPATRLLGKAPDGMNATGEGDERNYNTMVAGRQENELRPLLDQVDAVMLPSIGVADPDVGYEFAPLSVLSEKEKADIAKTKADTINTYALSNLVPTIALEKGVQNMLVEDGLLPGLDGALAELPEDERFPSLSEPDDDDLLPGDAPAVAANENTTARPPAKAKVRAANDARFNDAKPQTLYVCRKLLNADELIAWAKGQGFETTTPADELHVTIAFSKVAIDWMKVGRDWSSDADGNLTVAAGGPRIVQALGDKGAVVLLFASNDLAWRHQAIREAGASFDFDEYQPHVTITYKAPADLDLASVKPYTGPLKFGPELFSQVVTDWEKTVIEDAEGEQGLPFGDGYNPGQPRDRRGRFTSGSSAASIMALVRRAHARPGQHFSHELGQAGHPSPAHVHGFARRMQADGVRHAIEQHGNAAAQRALGQKRLTKADLSRVPAVIASAHLVKVHGGLKGGRGQSISYHARVAGHEYVYVETVGMKRRQLTMKTMWKK